MKAEFKIEKPGQVECTMTITMRLDEWLALNREMGSKYPAWKLSQAIGELVRKAETEFTATGEKKD